MDSSDSTNAGDVNSSKSFPERFAGVFIEPRETFADIVRRPDFLWPLVLLVIAGIAVTETMLAKIGVERFVRNSLEQSGQAARLSAEQLEQAVRQAALAASISVHAGGILGAAVYTLIIAAIGLALLNGIFGAQLKFKTVFSVSCYANLPGLLGSLMALALILFGDPENFNLENPVPSNLGFFLDPRETSKPLLVLTSSYDIFTLWILSLVGIGLSEAAGRKVGAWSIFLVYFGLWTVWVLGKVGIVMLTS